MLIPYRYLLEKCDIILVYNKQSWIHRLIAKVTSRNPTMKASHSLMYLFDDLVAEAGWTGTRIKNLEEYIVGKHTIHICRYKDKLTQDQIQKITRSALINAGICYSYIQLAGLLFKYIFHFKAIGDLSKKAMICSEYNCRAYKDGGIYLFDKNCAEVVPQDYLENDSLNKIGLYK